MLTNNMHFQVEGISPEVLRDITVEIYDADDDCPFDEDVGR